MPLWDFSFTAFFLPHTSRFRLERHVVLLTYYPYIYILHMRQLSGCIRRRHPSITLDFGKSITGLMLNSCPTASQYAVRNLLEICAPVSPWGFLDYFRRSFHSRVVETFLWLVSAFQFVPVWLKSVAPHALRWWVLRLRHW